MNVQIKKDGTDNNQSVRLMDLSASGISPRIVNLRLYISRIIQYIRNNARNIRIKATKNHTYPWSNITKRIIVPSAVSQYTPMSQIPCDHILWNNCWRHRIQAIPEINHSGVEIKWNSIPNSGRAISFPIPDSIYPENRETVNVRVDKTKRSESSADLSRLNCRPNSPILLLKLKVSTNRFCVVYNSIFFHSLF